MTTAGIPMDWNMSALTPVICRGLSTETMKRQDPQAAQRSGSHGMEGGGVIHNKHMYLS